MASYIFCPVFDFETKIRNAEQHFLSRFRFRDENPKWRATFSVPFSISRRKSEMASYTFCLVFDFEAKIRNAERHFLSRFRFRDENPKCRAAFSVPFSISRRKSEMPSGIFCPVFDFETKILNAERHFYSTRILHYQSCDIVKIFFRKSSCVIATHLYSRFCG